MRCAHALRHSLLWHYATRRLSSRSRDREGRTEERKKRVVLDDDGAVLFRARQGGNNDAPRCEDRTCHKKSWCAHSHTHLQ